MSEGRIFLLGINLRQTTWRRKRCACYAEGPRLVSTGPNHAGHRAAPLSRPPGASDEPRPAVNLGPLRLRRSRPDGHSKPQNSSIRGLGVAPTAKHIPGQSRSSGIVTLCLFRKSEKRAKNPFLLLQMIAVGIPLRGAKSETSPKPATYGRHIA